MLLGWKKPIGPMPTEYGTPGRRRSGSAGAACENVAPLFVDFVRVSALYQHFCLSANGSPDLMQYPGDWL